MYAQGTSTAVSMKGFFFKHGYQKTWRQTEMAKLCAPPRKKAFWPALLFLVIAAGGTFAVYVDRMPTAVSSRVMVFCFFLAGLGVPGYVQPLLESAVFPSTNDRVPPPSVLSSLRHGDQGVNYRYLRVKRSQARSGRKERS